MKTTLVFLASFCAWCSVCGQGTLHFANRAAGLDAPFLFHTGENSADFEARLMAGPDPQALSPVGPAASFSFVISTNCGSNAYFSGGIQTIPNIPGGATAYVRVEVWWVRNTPPWSGPERVAASQVFPVTLATPPTIPTRLLGLTPLTIWTCLGPYWYEGSGLVSQAVPAGQRVWFHAEITACPAPRYQWFFNNVAIPGATNGIYEINSVQPQHAGTYAFSATQSCYGRLSFRSGILTVLLPPAITTSPLSQTAEAGSSLQFLGAASGDPWLQYQWRFNNAPLNDATNTYLRLTNVQLSQSGTYTFIATNAYGAATSSPALLNVIDPVSRRWVPGIVVQGETPWNLDAAPELSISPDWNYLATLEQPGTSPWYFEGPDLPQRFYRGWQTNQPGPVPTLAIHLVPELFLTGSIGSTTRIEAINKIGPTGAWFTVSEVVITNSAQVYRDTSVVGQPPRLWRVTAAP